MSIVTRLAPYKPCGLNRFIPVLPGHIFPGYIFRKTEEMAMSFPIVVDCRPGPDGEPVPRAHRGQEPAG